MYLKTVVMALAVSLLACQSTSAQFLWSEEFNGENIDSSTWVHDVGGHGFGNGQLEFNTAEPANSYVKDGNLVIEARREDYRGNAFTSARMTTKGKFAFQYGTLEARIKFPETANGIWPAFWMLGNNFPETRWPRTGEIDIVEIGGKDGIAQGLQGRKINCAIHFADENDQKDMAVAWYVAPVDLHLDYHRYKVSWTPKQLTFYLDDVEFGKFDITADHLREFHQPYFLILNVAIGSWESSYTGVDHADAITAPFPAKMQVDWIRLTPNEHTKLLLGEEEQKVDRTGKELD